MKKLTILATVVAAVAALSSCEPEVFSMLVDMRGVPSSGLDLAGRSISVVYMDDLSGKDTVFNKNIAQGFAKAIEQDYFDGSGPLPYTVLRRTWLRTMLRGILS